jgi:hypothetical protein
MLYSVSSVRNAYWQAGLLWRLQSNVLDCMHGRGNCLDECDGCMVKEVMVVVAVARLFHAKRMKVARHLIRAIMLSVLNNSVFSAAQYKLHEAYVFAGRHYRKTDLYYEVHACMQTNHV